MGVVRWPAPARRTAALLHALVAVAAACAAYPGDCTSATATLQLTFRQTTFEMTSNAPSL